MKIDDIYTYQSTLKETSKDDSNLKDIKYMSGIDDDVIYFDKVKEKYTSDLINKPIKMPLSNDTLFKKGDFWYFIEFKNGLIDNRVNMEIKLKLYDSLLILLDLLNKGISFAREKIVYILVFNEETLDNQKLSHQFNKKEYLESNQIASIDSPSRMTLVSLLDGLSGNLGRPQFGLERYKSFLFKDVFTIPKYRFDDFYKKL